MHARASPNGEFTLVRWHPRRSGNSSPASLRSKGWRVSAMTNVCWKNWNSNIRCMISKVL